MQRFPTRFEDPDADYFQATLPEDPQEQEDDNQDPAPGSLDQILSQTRNRIASLDTPHDPDVFEFHGSEPEQEDQQSEEEAHSSEVEEPQPQPKKRRANQEPVIPRRQPVRNSRRY